MIDDSDAAARVEGEGGEPCSPPSPAAASTAAVDDQAASAPAATAAIPAAPSARAVSPHCAIIVLGDVGRSPRMQYHADAITKQPLTADEKHWTVELVGYEGQSTFWLNPIGSDPMRSAARGQLTRSIGTIGSAHADLIAVPVCALCPLCR